SRGGNLRIVVVYWLRAVLVADVLRDRFVGHIATRRYKVAASPEMAAPILFLDMIELHHDLSRHLTLDELHDPARRQSRRAGKQHVDMIPRNGSLQYLNLVRAAYLLN